MEGPALSIVIPAFREGAKIETDIRAAHDYLSQSLSGSGEIIVVDDGSPDDTAARAEALRRDCPELRVIRCAQNRGKGFALRTGIAASRGRQVMVADAGHCVPFAEAAKGLALVARGTAFAHGSRRAAGASIERAQPGYRRIGSRLFWLFVRGCMGIPRGLSDTQCGFKVYDGSAARRVYRESFSDGFMLDIELIRRAKNHGLEIREFPVKWRCDTDSRYAPVAGTLRNLHELVRIRLRC